MADTNSNNKPKKKKNKLENPKVLHAQQMILDGNIRMNNDGSIAVFDGHKWITRKDRVLESGYVLIHIDKNADGTYKHDITYMLSHDGEIAIEIDHIDGNRSNNSPENLKSVTHSDNIKKSRRQGKRKEVNKSEVYTQYNLLMKTDCPTVKAAFGILAKAYDVTTDTIRNWVTKYEEEYDQKAVILSIAITPNSVDSEPEKDR